MMVDPIVLVIGFLCLAGTTYTSWQSGHAAGVENTLSYLESEGIIEFDTKEE
ncbi:hypothetical protein OAA37_00560 [bacterium]|jgi:hypothetical protein|nr:hypothetical protein [bacterium]